MCLSLEECGERELFLATSGIFSPAIGNSNEGEERATAGDVARGTTGEVGNGVYGVGWDCESAYSSPSGATAFKVLADLRERGMVGEIWRHTESVFERVAGGK